MANPLVRLNDEGVSPWLDNLSRDMFTTGSLERLIREDGIKGQTSNPTIFQKAISGGSLYDDQIVDLARKGMNAEDIVWEIMVTDVRSACDTFKPLFESTGGKHGHVSLELNPTMAHDTQGSLAQAKQLVQRVDRPNLFIKVPGTPEGLPVITELLSEGVNVNVTLLFAVEVYEKVIDAYLAGLEQRLEKGGSIATLQSVASFFVSRVDTEADKRMDKRAAGEPSLKPRIDALRGRVAVANARLAYDLFEKKFSGERWERLKAKGGQAQRPLWASTGTKNKAYSDTLYVAELIGPDCVNTMPDETIDAFRDHGEVKRTLTAETIADAHAVCREFADLGFDLSDITQNTLVKEGVQKFADSYHELVEAVRVERELLLSRK